MRMAIMFSKSKMIEKVNALVLSRSCYIGSYDGSAESTKVLPNQWPTRQRLRNLGAAFVDLFEGSGASSGATLKDGCYKSFKFF